MEVRRPDEGTCIQECERGGHRGRRKASRAGDGDSVGGLHGSRARRKADGRIVSLCCCRIFPFALFPVVLILCRCKLLFPSLHYCRICYLSHVIILHHVFARSSTVSGCFHVEPMLSRTFHGWKRILFGVECRSATKYFRIGGPFSLFLIPMPLERLHRLRQYDQPPRKGHLRLRFRMHTNVQVTAPYSSDTGRAHKS